MKIFNNLIHPFDKNSLEKHVNNSENARYAQYDLMNDLKDLNMKMNMFTHSNISKLSISINDAVLLDV